MGAALLECQVCSFRFQNRKFSQNSTKMYRQCGGIEIFWTEIVCFFAPIGAYALLAKNMGRPAAR